MRILLHFYQPDAIDENTCTVGTKSAIILLLLTVDVMYVDLDLHVDLYVYTCDCSRGTHPSSTEWAEEAHF